MCLGVFSSPQRTPCSATGILQVIDTRRFILCMLGIPFNSDECPVTALTEYEVGNVLWLEHQLGMLKDARMVAVIFSEVLRSLRRFDIDSLPDVLAVAVERNLAFYDASYVSIAERHKLKLVTQDSDLLKKCINAIPTGVYHYYNLFGNNTLYSSQIE